MIALTLDETKLYERLTEKRKKHTMGVLEYGLHLCALYGGDTARFRFAALCHDLFRGISVEKLNPIVEREGLPAKYLGNPSLAHGKLAALEMERAYGVEDPDILNAVNYHTTGRADMSLLEKILYVADAAEPGRDYPDVDTLRVIAEKNLDEACLYSMEHTISHVKELGGFLDEDTVKAAEFLRHQLEK